MRYEKTIKISKKEAHIINKYLTIEPTCESECFGEDETITNTTIFDNGIEVDIKCCGVKYEENASSNTAWAEAVMFLSGSEVCCTDPCDEYLGEWMLEYEDNEYVVIVEVA